MKYVTSLFVLTLLVLFLVSGCTTKDIYEIKSEEYIGKTVTVQGEVINSIKIGSLSGYTVRDDSGEQIGVSSDTLPKEGTTVRVKGTLIKDTLLGYYIKEE